MTISTALQSAPEPQPAPSSSIEATSDGERHARLVAIALMCGAVACFAGLDATGKYLSRSLPVLEVVWARYAVSALMTVVAINPWTAPGAYRSRRPGLQLARSALLLVSTIVNFAALQYLQLAETVSILFAMPLLVALLAGPMLGEWVGPRRLAAIAVGFVGVLVITHPGVGSLQWAMGLTLISVLLYALYNISTRMLAAWDSSRTTFAYSALAGALGLAPAMPFVWQWPQGAAPWLLMIVMGGCASVGHYMLIVAHRHAPAAVLSPFVYTQLIWMSGLGYLIFGDIPGPLTLSGAAIVIGSGLYLLSRERVVKGR
jgi:drug/metabolite transporter (DMT)-like permease